MLRLECVVCWIKRGESPNSSSRNFRYTIVALMKGSIIKLHPPGDRSSTSGASFLDGQSFATLQAASARLIPQPDREQFLGIARTIDHRLAEETAGRWPRGRFLEPESFALGLRGLNDLARTRLRCDFAKLDSVRQDQILHSLQNGTAGGSIWATLSPRDFLAKLSQECNEIYETAPAHDEAVSF